MVEEGAPGGSASRTVPARYVLAVLGSFGMAIVYGLKVNLSVALVGMLNHTALEAVKLSTTTTTIAVDNSSCEAVAGNSSAPEDGPFTWSEPDQGWLLSSYFWGYIVAQLPGGRVAELVSAKWVMFFSVAINVVCTLLSPLAAKLHFIAFIVMRIGEGIGGGVTFPAMHVLLSKWAPPKERSVMSSIVYAGTALGTVISMLSAGVICSSLGWEAVFYLMGGVCAIWLIVWIIFIADTPEKQRFISAAERSMIANALAVEAGPVSEASAPKSKPPVPWKRVFTSLPFLAILVAHTCSNWGWYMVLIELPFYMKQVLKFNITENAVLTAIPFLIMWFFSMILSKTLDALRARDKLSTTWARKIATLIASVVPGICLATICFVGCHRVLAVVIMAIAITAIGGMFCGFLANHIDIAPNYAGTLVAITNTVATIPGIAVPIFVGALTHGNQTIGAWRVIFFVTVGLYVVEVIFYTLFASGDMQPWNQGDKGRGTEPEAQPLKSTPNKSAD